MHGVFRGKSYRKKCHCNSDRWRAFCAAQRLLFVLETRSGFGLLIALVDVYDEAGRFSGLADRLISLVRFLLVAPNEGRSFLLVKWDQVRRFTGVSATTRRRTGSF